jgi:hypothetical protein
MTLDVGVKRGGEYVSGIHWDVWVLQTLALTKALDDNIVTLEEVKRDAEDMSEEPTLVDGVDETFKTHKKMWERVWEHWWTDTKCWRSGGHKVKEDRSWVNPLEKDLMGIKGGQRLDLKAGDVITTNI